MAFTTSTPVPFQWVNNQNSISPAATQGSYGESATQTFKVGTPVAVASGTVAAWGGTDPAGLPVISGISTQPGQNLTTASTAQVASFGSVPNQSSAVNAYMTGPVPLGTNTFLKAGAGNVFRGLLGNNGASATPAITNIGTAYGLTKDSTTGCWYVDTNKSTSGTNTAVVIVALDPLTSANGSNITANTLVDFVFQSAVVIQS
jgi:hypothetical protein